MHNGTFRYNPARAAKPYRWAQHLAGLDFAPPLPLAGGMHALLGEEGARAAQTQVMEGLESYRRQARVQQLVERLLSLKAGDDALK